MAGSDRRLHAIVQGRVQGVGYRMFAQREARRLLLEGWVKNLPDGSVEVVAEGADSRLAEFLGRLREGPAGGWVMEVQVEWCEADGSFGGFSIRH